MTAVEEADRIDTRDFLIYRVDTDGHPEIAGESSQEIEARRFAGIMHHAEPERGVYYEVRVSTGDELLFTTR